MKEAEKNVNKNISKSPTRSSKAREKYSNLPQNSFSTINSNFTIHTKKRESMYTPSNRNKRSILKKLDESKVQISDTSDFDSPEIQARSNQKIIRQSTLTLMQTSHIIKIMKTENANNSQFHKSTSVQKAIITSLMRKKITEDLHLQDEELRQPTFVNRFKGWFRSFVN